MEYPQRIQFDTNVDELVDATTRYWTRTKAGRSQRRRGVLAVAAVFTASSCAAFLITSGAVRGTAGAPAIISALIVAMVLGAAFWPLYGRLHDRGFRRRLRRALTKEAGERTTWTCEIELRAEGAWSRNRGVEILFDWKEAIAVEDAGDGVELRFRGGFMMARNKAFESAADGRRFLEMARGFAA